MAMLKAAAHTDQGTLILLGLSFENLKRLAKGEPIPIDMTEFGYSSGQIVIFSGETEEAMGKEMAGLIGPETKVRTMPRPPMDGRPRNKRR